MSGQLGTLVHRGYPSRGGTPGRLLALYVGSEALGRHVDQRAPEVTLVGIVLAVVSVIVMPILARVKKRLGHTLGSQAVVSEPRQTELCPGSPPWCSPGWGAERDAARHSTRYDASIRFRAL